MSPGEKVEALVSAGDAKAVHAYFLGMPEAERRKHRAAAREAFERCHKASFSMSAFREDRTREQWASRGAQIDAARTAVLATLDDPEWLRRYAWRSLPPSELAYGILADRRPEWIDRYVAFACETRRCWPLVRRLVVDGVCATPTVDDYIIGMLLRLSRRAGRWSDGDVVPIPDQLRADPGPAGARSVARLRGRGGPRTGSFTAVERSWGPALIALSESGELDRGRLLDASLGALQRDFAHHKAGGFARFHESLAPTIVERSQRAEAYMALLASPIGPTVTLALKALTKVLAKGELDRAQLVDSLAPAVLSPTKGTAKKALKLLDRVAKKDAALREAIAVAAVAGLSHEAPDVQTAAIEVIERWGESEDTGLCAAIVDALPQVAPSLQTRLALYGDVPDVAVAPADRGELLTEVEAMPPWARKVSRIDELLAAWDAREPLPVVVPAFGDVPRCRDETAVSPFETLPELVAELSAVIENAEDAARVERALDGLSRLCGERGENFEREVGPLRKRARTLAKRERWRRPLVNGTPELDLVGLVLVWTDGFEPEPLEVGEYVSAMDFVRLRLREVAEGVQAGVPSPLLAAPTHEDGWVDPRALVARLAAVPEPPRADLVQALLRLAPDGRAEVLAEAAEFPGDAGAAVRYALGGREEYRHRYRGMGGRWHGPVIPTQTIPPSPSASARSARTPATSAASGCSGSTRPTRTIGARHTRGSCSSSSVSPESRSRPTAGFRRCTCTTGTDWLETAAIHWLAAIWPQRREGWFANGFTALFGNTDWGGHEWWNHVYLLALFDRGTPLGDIGHLMLAAGLTAKEPREAGLSTDALIATIEDGRLDPAALGRAMEQMCDPRQASYKWARAPKAKRWARTLGDAARVSPLHAHQIRTAIEHALCGDPEARPRDVGALLELLRELSAAAGTGVRLAAARTYLAAIPGKGKAAKTAKQLLETRGRGALIADAVYADAVTGRLVWGT